MVEGFRKALRENGGGGTKIRVQPSVEEWNEPCGESTTDRKVVKGGRNNNTSGRRGKGRRVHGSCEASIRGNLEYLPSGEERNITCERSQTSKHKGGNWEIVHFKNLGGKKSRTTAFFRFK